MRGRQIHLGVFSIILLGIAFGVVGTARANPADAPFPQPTPFLTPTPGPDGRITYIVQDRDTFYDIAAIAGISLQELYALNGIQPGDYAIPGMQVLLGLAGPEAPTPLPDEFTTPTPIEPSPTPLFNTGEICVLLFRRSGSWRLQRKRGSSSRIQPHNDNELAHAIAGGRYQVCSIWRPTECCANRSN